VSGQPLRSLTKGRLTLNGIVRTGHWTDGAEYRAWKGKDVVIWSGQWESYWRPDGFGYTKDLDQAGIWTFEQAFKRTCGCGPEKRIEYRALRVERGPK